MSSERLQRYRARFQRVLRHIDEHLDDQLDVETLSAVAAFSPYHFHRLFSALFGIGVYGYIQLARLKRASYRLAFRDGCSITGIALDCGYEGSEAFSRAFKRRFGQTPSGFRRNPDWSRWHAPYASINRGRALHMTIEGKQPRIVEFKETAVAMLEHRGDPTQIGHSVRRFIDWRRQVGLLPRLSATYNILYDNPADVPPEDFRLGICVATDSVAPNIAGIVATFIPGGRCAVLRHVGSDDALAERLDYLYASWLPESREELRDFPPFLQRVSFFPDVAEHEAVTDIFVPLRDRPGRP